MQRRIVSLFATMLAAAVAVGCGSQDAKLQQDVPSVGSVSAAAVPPPPVNQSIGIPDGVIGDLTAATCIGCHGQATAAYPAVCTDPLGRCPQIADRHHLLLQNPAAHPNITGCLTCHSPAPGSNSGVSVLVDCTQCHRGASPHHGTVQARAGQCDACHGNLVQRFGDGHYIPTSAPSLITPGTGDSQCKVRNAAGACIAGACSACHQPADATATTRRIYSNADTHHTAIVPTLGEAACGACHSLGGGTFLNIRSCENCHGPASLHAIQANPTETTGTPGYGHIGTDQDCWGCHGFFARFDTAPENGPVIPNVRSVEVVEGSFLAGSATVIRVNGQSLTNTVQNLDGSSKTFDPTVALTQSDEAGNMNVIRVLESGYVTSTSLLARIPADLPAGNWDLRVAKDPRGPQQVLSNKLQVSILPAVAITSAQASGNTVTLTGTGFGAPPGEAASLADLGVSMNDQQCTVAAAKWSDGKVEATCPEAPNGATVKLTGVYNSNAPVKGVVGAAATPAPAPTPAPPPAPIPDAPAPAEVAPVASMSITAGGNTSSCSAAAACSGISVRSGRTIACTAGPAASYQWTVSSGSRVVKSSTAKSFSTSLSGGSYTMKLVVKSPSGKSSTASVALSVR